MRLKSLSISGFRGFASTVDFDLDADAIVLVGANGSGKTSLLDAILWALSGNVPRLGTAQETLLSRFSSTGELRVELALTTPDGRPLNVTRRWDGETTFSVIDGDDHLRGPSAEARILERLWPDARAASDPQKALARALTRGVYLQQDLLRQFLDADDEQERFAVIGEIVGTGRVAELQRQLESGKASWTRSTNVLGTELHPLQSRRAAITQRLERLGESDDGAATAANVWNEWAQRAREYVSVPDLGGDSQEAARILDGALKELQALQLQTDRRLGSVTQLVEHLQAGAPQSVPVDPLRAAVAEAEKSVAEAHEKVRVAQDEAAAQRRRQTEARSGAEELKALAQLALRHLDENCPVCAQKYDVAGTRKRLEELLRDETGSAQETLIDVGPLAAEAERRERLLVEASSALLHAEQAARVVADWQRTRDQLVQDTQLVAGDPVQGPSAAAQALQEQAEGIRALRQVGDQLSLQLARTGELAQKAQLEGELASLQAQIAGQESEIASRTATGDLAAEILAALREASSEIVAAELERVSPILQRIYATVDPHPAFRAVHLLTKTVRGRGQLWATIDDATADVTVDEPAKFLSSSQVNVLALSVFLALNLGIDTLPLDVVALDDPLQSLDDVNLLGFVDLLRRMKGRRQIVVSTHDPRFGALLCRKLRPVSAEGRSRFITLEGWTREGPSVIQDDLPRDPKPLRLVA